MGTASCDSISADVITVDLQTPRLTPVLLGQSFNIDSHLVYAARGPDVKDVIIDGRIIVEAGHIQTVNEKMVMEAGTKTAQQLLDRIL